MIEMIERGYIKDPAVTRQIEYMCARLKGLLTKVLDQDGNLIVADPNYAVFAVGDIKPTTRPSDQLQTGWLVCDGSQVSRVKYNDLFRVIGTTYGAGNGTTTFNLPDMTGRFPLGKRNTGAGSNLGDTGGQFDHTHSFGSHTHTFSATSGAAGGHSHSLSIDAAGSHSHSVTASGTTGDSDNNIFVPDDPNEELLAHSSHHHTVSVTGSTDSGGSHSHTGSTDSESNHTHSVSGTTGASSGADTGAGNPPYMAVNYLIFTGVAA